MVQGRTSSGMFTRVVVTTNEAEAHRVFMRFAQVDSKARGQKVLQAAKREVPKGKTGALFAGLSMSQSRDTRGRWATGWDIFSNAPHTLFVIKGTRPHPIVGNPLLAFFWPKMGRNVVFRHVMHPGTKANDFLSRALRAGRGSAV